MTTFGGTALYADVYSFQVGASDLTGLEGTAVKLDANGNVVPVAAATDRAIGWLRDGNASGETVGVYADGIVPVKASASGIAPGDLLGVTSGGLAVKLVAGTDTTKYIHAVAVEASTGAGDFISARLVIPVAKAA